MMVGMKSMVVAYDLKRGIGAANDIMWMGELPADMKHFREHTLGTSVVMGRKTYESIGRPLPDRQNIVVTRSGAQIDGVTVVDSLTAAYAAATHEVAGMKSVASITNQTSATNTPTTSWSIAVNNPASTVIPAQAGIQAFL
jgi:dihydrofolate reductase